MTVDEAAALAFRDLAAAHRAGLHQSDLARIDLIDVPHVRMWRPEDAEAVRAAEDLRGLLSTYDAEAFRRHAGYVNPESTAKYLRMTALRVAHLLDLLRSFDVRPGASVLEVGSLFGSFALPLARLGYRVTVSDRYGTMDGALDAYVGLLKAEGVAILSSTREHEEAEIAALPTFDAVIAMAVVEHIPHTPRPFLESLLRRVRPGGVLALDTPNLVRYWNRKRLAAGETIFQPLEMQYPCDPPWEGHHREYTPAEMTWMMGQIGLEGIDLRMLDYNMLQFERIDRPHIECLLACIADPTMADVILVGGRRP